MKAVLFLLGALTGAMLTAFSLVVVATPSAAKVAPTDSERSGTDESPLAAPAARPVEASRTETPTETHDGESGAGSELDDNLLTLLEEAPAADPTEFELVAAEELARVVEHGALHRLLLEDEDELIDVVVQAWLTIDRPDLAFAAIRRFGLEGEAGEWVPEIASALEDQGRMAAAADVWFAAWPGRWEDEEFQARCLELDPARTLHALSSAAVEQSAVWTQALRALCLHRMGRSEDGLAAFLSAAREAAVPRELWELLAQQDRAAAIRTANDSLESGSAYDATWLHAQLVRWHSEEQNWEAALDSFESSLDSPGRDLSLYYELSSVDPERSFAWLESIAQRDSDPGVRTLYADQLLAQERTDEAVRLLWSLCDSSPLQLDSAWISDLLEHDSERAIVEFRRRGREIGDDEALGDVADALWYQGRQAEALELWRHALFLDSSDSEWRDKVERMERGADPMSWD